jgi:serine/threonine-protein kinase/endoribonuclease IRE1
MGCSRKLEIDQSSFSGSAHSGSMGWQAPEILLLKQQGKTVRITKRMDVFSLGCIFYYMITKAHPFGDTYEREANIIKNKPNLNKIKQKEPEAYHLISRMLAPKAEERYE